MTVVGITTMMVTEVMVSLPSELRLVLLINLLLVGYGLLIKYYAAVLLL
jgi:flagellar biosynthesis protein FliP